jgi:hypothetical protein
MTAENVQYFTTLIQQRAVAFFNADINSHPDREAVVTAVLNSMSNTKTQKFAEEVINNMPEERFCIKTSDIAVGMGGICRADPQSIVSQASVSGNRGVDMFGNLEGSSTYELTCEDSTKILLIDNTTSCSAGSIWCKWSYRVVCNGDEQLLDNIYFMAVGSIQNCTIAASTASSVYLNKTETLKDLFPFECNGTSLSSDSPEGPYINLIANQLPEESFCKHNMGPAMLVDLCKIEINSEVQQIFGGESIISECPEQNSTSLGYERNCNVTCNNETKVSGNAYFDCVTSNTTTFLNLCNEQIPESVPELVQSIFPGALRVQDIDCLSTVLNGLKMTYNGTCGAEIFTWDPLYFVCTKNLPPNITVDLCEQIFPSQISELEQLMFPEQVAGSLNETSLAENECMATVLTGCQQGYELVCGPEVYIGSFLYRGSC